MADIKKVIKGSEWCISVNGCVGCPYEDNCLNIEEKLPGQALIRDAIELLNEYKEHEELLNKLGYHWTGNGETLALCRESRVGEQE